MMAMRSPGRSRNPLTLFYVLPDTKILTIKLLNKKLDVQPMGKGGEVYTKGMFKKPIQLEEGWQKMPFNNGVVLFNKGSLDTINLEFRKKYLEQKFQNSRLASENSILKSQLIYVRSHVKDLSQAEVKFTLGQVERLKPVMLNKKSGQRA